MDQRSSFYGNKKYRKLNKNENTTSENLWNTAKPMLRGKFLALNT
jgi:hypothetical protein